MADIIKIEVQCWTKSGNDSGTDDHVYLGLGGREFCLDTSANDFESGSNQIFILGDGSNLNDASKNDPRNPKLNTADLSTFPEYIRKSGAQKSKDDDGWYVERVNVTVNPGSSEIKYSRLAGRDALWLSNESGRMLYLKRV